MPTSAFFISFAIFATVDMAGPLSSSTKHARRVHTMVQGDANSRVKTEITKSPQTQGTVALGLSDYETKIKSIELSPTSLSGLKSHLRR